MDHGAIVAHEAVVESCSRFQPIKVLRTASKGEHCTVATGCSFAETQELADIILTIPEDLVQDRSPQYQRKDLVKSLGSRRQGQQALLDSSLQITQGFRECVFRAFSAISCQADPRALRAQPIQHKGDHEAGRHAQQAE